MIANPTHPDDVPPRSAGALRLFGYLFAALAVFYVYAVVGGAFPRVVVQVTGSALIVFVLVNISTRWIGWIRSDGAAPSLVRRAITTAVAALLVYIFFRETWFDPLPGGLGTALALSFFPLVLGSIMWSVARMRDEVCRASAYQSFAWGGLVGLALTYAGIVVLRFTPAMSDWLQTKAVGMSAASAGLSPAAIGFAFGATFSLMAVWLSLFVAWALWWRRIG